MLILNEIDNLYSNNVAQYGPTPKSVGWRDEESQDLRFEKLAMIIDSESCGSGFSVCDLGCGYGAMFKYLKAKFPDNLKSYVGYDISDEMLQAAGDQIRDPRIKLVKSNKVSDFADYCFVSGTFNVRMTVTNEDWTKHVKDSLLNMAEHCKKGLGFNLLSVYVDWKEEHLYYGDPFIFFDFCKSQISPYISLIHDYPLYEWTILVKK